MLNMKWIVYYEEHEYSSITIIAVVRKNLLCLTKISKTENIDKRPKALSILAQGQARFLRRYPGKEIQK